jgi:DNA-binding transcriptional ArsR family regulator
MLGEHMKGINLGEPSIVLGENKLRVELDRKALFALASDTRLEILKALQSERRTVSQLADTLGVDKAAVYRHLKKLEEGEFVKREDDHGFVYYRLSWKARDIISPGENTRIIVLISSSLVLMIIAAFLLIGLTAGSSTPFQDAQEAGNGYEPTDSRDPGLGVVNNDNILSYLVIGLIASISIILVVWAARTLWRPKQANPFPDGNLDTLSMALDD